MVYDLGHRHERTGADQDRNGREAHRHRYLAAAVVNTAVEKVDPAAGGQLHADLGDPGVGNGRNQEGVAPQVGAGFVDQRRVGFVLEKQRPHQRHAGRAVLPGERVDVREQRIPQPDVVADDRAGLAVVEYGFRRNVLLCMRAIDRLEYAVLEPAYVKLFVEYFTAGKTAQIRMDVGQPQQAHLQAELDLRLQAAPAPADVTGPGHHAVTLRAQKTGTHQDHGPGVRVTAGLVLVHHFRPDVAVRVVDFVGGRLDPCIAQPVQGVRRVYLGLAEVPPGAGDTDVEQRLVGAPEPLSGVLVEDVDESGVTEIEVEPFRRARGVASQYPVRRRILPALRRGQDERFGYRHRADSTPGKVPDHVSRIRPGFPVPVEITHVPLDVGPEPVDVQDDGVQRYVRAFEPSDDIAGFGLVAVAESGGIVAEGPARRQRLAAGRVGIVADQRRITVARDDDVGRASAHRLELQHVLLGGGDVQPAAGAVVEGDDVLVARQHRRQAVIHLLRFGLVAVVRAVVERQAPAAPVHAHDALAAAQDFFVFVQPKPEPAKRIVGEIAVFLGNEYPAVLLESQPHRRFVDDRGQSVDPEPEVRLYVADVDCHVFGKLCECERRQLFDAVLLVVHLESRVVDGPDAQLADTRFDDQRLTDDCMVPVFAEIGAGNGSGKAGCERTRGNGKLSGYRHPASLQFSISSNNTDLASSSIERPMLNRLPLRTSVAKRCPPRRSSNLAMSISIVSSPRFMITMTVSRSS